MLKQAGSIARRTALPGCIVLAALAAAAGPAGAAVQLREGKQVVDSVCIACHGEGKEGAPKIGDRAAWTPRLSRGLDTLVDVAVTGHGSMPARGGMVQLEREELRRAIVYMFNYGLPPVMPPEPVAADPRHKTIAGTDIYFGVIQASQIEPSQSGMLKGAIPTGRDYYHLNLSLADARTGAPVGDAQVTLKVSDGVSAETKTLGPIAANKAVSYGNFFRLSSGSAYTIQAEIKRPGLARPIVTAFDYRAP
jgi:cytochrome c5